MTNKLINNPTASSKQASHIAYHVREGNNKGKAYWNRIGLAWTHADGNGFNIQFDSVPLSGRTGLRTIICSNSSGTLRWSKSDAKS